MATEKFDNAFKKNVSDTFKVWQDSTKAVIEAQSKQFAFATEAYNKLLNTFAPINKNGTNVTGSPEHINEQIRQGFDTLSSFSKSMVNQAFELSKQASSSILSHEVIDNVVENYRRQTSALAEINQQYIDTLPDYVKSANEGYSTLLRDKLKKDLDDNLHTSKQQLHAIIESYNKVTNPAFENGTVFFNEVNDQIRTTINVNLNLWSKLLSTYVTPESYNAEDSLGKNVGNDRKAKNAKETVEN